MKLKELLTVTAEMGAINALRNAGVVTGEITYDAALRKYGRWFEEAVKCGELNPVRLGSGSMRPRRYFLLTDILALKSAQYQQSN